jgi:hypothetical protein
MPSKELTVVEKIEINLFKSKGDSKVVLSSNEETIKERYQKTFVHWHAHPELRDTQIIEYLINDCSVSMSQAYRDLPNIKYLLGNVRNASKEWHRYMVVEMCKEAFQKAKAKKNWIAMILAADKIGKYTQCDKDEQERMPWNEIVPPEFEASTDITLLNPKLYNPEIEELRSRLRAKYSGEVSDADYTMVQDVKK